MTDQNQPQNAAQPDICSSEDPRELYTLLS